MTNTPTNELYDLDHLVLMIQSRVHEGNLKAVKTLITTSQIKMLDRLITTFEQRDLYHAAQDMETQDTSSRRRELIWVNEKLQSEKSILEGQLNKEGARNE